LVTPNQAITGQLAIARWPWAAAACADRVRHFILFWSPFKKIKIKALTCSKGLGFSRRVRLQQFHFLKLAPTLGSIPHGAWRFHFFPNFFLLKVKDT
jgi:hypothetical protein